MALLGGLLLIIGIGLQLGDLLIAATFALTLAGGTLLLIGIIGLLTLQVARSRQPINGNGNL